MADHVGDQMKLLEVICQPDGVQIETRDPGASRQSCFHASRLGSLSLGPATQLTLELPVENEGECLRCLESGVIVDLFSAPRQEFIQIPCFAGGEPAVQRKLIEDHRNDALVKALDIDLENTRELVGGVHFRSLGSFR